MKDCWSQRLHNGESTELCQFRYLPCCVVFGLVHDIKRNVMFLPSQYRNINSMLCPWASHLTIKCFTWLRWKWVPGRKKMAMFMINSMRQKSCRTVCSPWNEQVEWPGGENVKFGWNTWYQTINLHLYLFILVTSIQHHIFCYAWQLWRCCTICLRKTGNSAGPLVQWLKLPDWKAGDREFEPHSGLKVSKTQNSRSFVRIRCCGEPL